MKVTGKQHILAAFAHAKKDRHIVLNEKPHAFACGLFLFTLFTYIIDDSGENLYGICQKLFVEIIGPPVGTSLHGCQKAHE